MDLFFSYLIYFVLFSVSLAIIHLANSRLRSSSSKLPPGRTGWPVIGEILEFAFAARRGKPERFINDRMKKYSPEVFRTSLMGENMAVICGASGNRFLFSNEDKLVSSWWPSLMKKILYSPSLFDNPPKEDLMRPSSSVHEFLKPEALKHYVEIMDMMARKHVDMYWNSKEEVKVYPLSKKYTFDLSCRLFMNIEDPQSVTKISDGFDRIMAGFISLPINIPGTAFNHAIKARNNLHKEIGEIIRKRKEELTESSRDSDSPALDLLSRMLLMNLDENIEVPSEIEVTTRITAMILASHETTSTAITFALWYLAEFPDVYDAVLKGNIPTKPS